MNEREKRRKQIDDIISEDKEALEGLVDMLSEKEVKVRDYLFGKIVPTLESFLHQQNPEKFKTWGGNCCNQTAFVCCYVLKKELKEYKWSVKEWDFIFATTGEKYNHAFVIGEKPNKILLVDLSRHPIWNDVFMEIRDIDNPYKETTITDMVIEKREVPYNWLLREREYYSGIQGKELAEIIIERCEVI